MKLVLASSSPRRIELMRFLKVKFEVRIPLNVNESKVRKVPEDVEELAYMKARSVMKSVDDVIIGADTVVVIDGEILGKPRDEMDARRMLYKLSDRWHEVYTGVCIMGNEWVERFNVRTSVKFAELSEKLVDFYLKTGEYRDKAGAYGIQELGALLVERIEGDFYNVVGFPLRRIWEVLERRGIWA